MERDKLKKKFIGKKRHVRRSRSGETYLEFDPTKEEKIIKAFHNKPHPNADKEPSTHFMSHDDNYAYPTITEKKDGTGFKEQSFDEALKAVEVYGFLSKKRAAKFGFGSWKKGRDRKEAMQSYREHNKNKKKQWQ